MKWASALVCDVDALSAVKGAAAQVRVRLEEAPDLVFAFASHGFARHAEAIAFELAKAFPTAHIIGCTGGGVIGDGHEAEDVPALSLTAAVLPQVTCTAFHCTEDEVPVLPKDTRACLLIADPFSCDPAKLVAALDVSHPETVKVGGLASGGTAPGTHRLFLDGVVHREGLVGVGLTGDVEVEALIAQGCRPLGPPMFATRVDGHVVLELDGKSPLTALEQVHEKATDEERRRMTSSLHIGVELKRGIVEVGGDFLVRNIVGIDPEARTLSVGALLKQYDVLQFMLRDARAAEEELTLALGEAQKHDAAGPVGALLFSCIGRGRFLFGCADHDTGLFSKTWADTALGGFFCNGEIGPLAGTTFLHGYTSAFALFRPAAGLG